VKVEYSHLKLDEVDQIRRKSLLDVPGTMKEDTLLALRAFPCLIADGIVIYFILRLNAAVIYPNLSPKIGQFIAKVTGESGFAKASAVYLLAIMIGLVILAVSMYLSVTAVNTVFGFLLKKLIPFTTPCIEQNKRNRKFYDDTKYILRDLITEDTVRQCLVSEEEVEIYLNDNTLEFHRKKDGYTQKTEVELSDRLKAHLESSNILDFTYLDEAWEAAVAEKGDKT